MILTKLLAMKLNNLIKRTFLMAMVATAATACEEEVNIGNVQAPDITGTSDMMLYVSDADGSTAYPKVEFRGAGSCDIYVNATKAMAADASVQFVYDAEVLAEYNKVNNTKFMAIAPENVALANEGVTTVVAGELKSAPMTITITSDGQLDSETTYVIPLKVMSLNGVELAQSAQSRLVFVRDLSNLQDCFKTVLNENGEEVPGVKIFSCMEVNDTNPLNNLRYSLKNSGKYMIDALIIFSGNINYDEVNARVYFNANPNVQHLLDNREKYLKPLQDRGMKVIMGVLCNHDRACISNLNDETARLFAKEMKSLCDAYNLDGVFYDDEYCSPMSPAPPGFTDRSRKQVSRLIYEIWKLQPERWNVAYCYSLTYGLEEVDGVQAGVYCQYALHDYGGSSDLSTYFPGMPKSNMGLYSQEFSMGRFASENNLRSMRKNGYGSHMVFAMDPNRSNASRQDDAMGNCARAFYDDEMVINEPIYKKDW